MTRIKKTEIIYKTETVMVVSRGQDIVSSTIRFTNIIKMIIFNF